MKMNRPILLVTTLAALAATAALAQPQQPPAPPHSAPSGATNAGLDPNQLICRSQATIGSRLNRQRVCATRQQWLDQIRADRTLTEKAQTNRTWCKESMPC
jgi:invasion protein IalB